MQVIPVPEDIGEQNLDNPYFCKLLIAILVQRHGGTVKISQLDFDKIAWCRLLTSDIEGQEAVYLKVEEPPKAS